MEKMRGIETVLAETRRVSDNGLARFRIVFWFHSRAITRASRRVARISAPSRSRRRPSGRSRAAPSSSRLKPPVLGSVSTYKRGYIMQASLAVVGGVLGLVACFSTLDWRWLLGAVVLLANWPYTIFVIMPTNRRQMNTPVEAAAAETRRMVRWWGVLHAGRSSLGLVATLIFLWAQR